MKLQNMKSYKSIALALVFAIAACMWALPRTAHAAEPSTDVGANTANVKVVDQAELEDIAERAGGTILQDARQISPGQSISGTFKLSNWFGTDFTVYLAVSDGSGSVGLQFVTAYNTVTCGDSVVDARETGWPSGTYSYSVQSNASSTVAYSLMILEN